MCIRDSKITILNEWVVAIHVALDFGIFYFNLFFESSYLPGYSFYLIILGLVHFVLSFF